MTGEDIFARISVFYREDGHIIVHDPFYPTGNPDNQYFDLHNAVLRLLNQDERKNLVEILGEQKEKVCQIYLHWKFREADGYVRKKAAEKFPLKERISDVNKTILLSEKPKSEILGNGGSVGRRETAIRAICQLQNIQQLIHFTHIDNLTNIFSFGLLGRDQISELPGSVTIRTNDELRTDGHRDAVCLSISFPNYRMFFHYHQGASADWVVIALRPDILWELDCAFCRENAASINVNRIPIEKRKQVNALEDLFRDIDRMKRSDLGIPPFYPTNPQAEILVFSRIHPGYIMT